MEPLLVYPEPAPAPLVQSLDVGGYPWVAVGASADVDDLQPDDGWSGAIICANSDAEVAFALCRALRQRDIPLEPLLVVVDPGQLDEL